MKLAVEHVFTGTTGLYSAGYDSTKTMLGQWIQQKTGNAPTDKYAGPFPMAMTRFFEQNGVAPCYPHVIDWGSNLHWVFVGDLSTAASTRRITLYTFNTATQVWSWRGFITYTPPGGSTYTVKGMRVVRTSYSTGTVTVSGTGVTGSSTVWQTARLAAGARIGFGSTSPTSITTWYYISAIGSETSITLTGSAGSIGAGSSYVIEELRVYTALIAGTATNGGLFVAKGINFDDFSTGGTTIAAAVSTDNLKAVYWLKDASTVTNTIAAGVEVGATAPTNTNHDMYVANADSATALRIYKYNVRAALSVASGISTDAFNIKTGAQTVTTTTSQTGAMKLATLGHGPGSGTACMYYVTTTKIYRIVETDITTTSTTFCQANTMTEVPTGSTATFAATAAMSHIALDIVTDRLIIVTSAGNRIYHTQFNTSATAIDRVFMYDDKQLESSYADPGIAIHPNVNAFLSHIWVENGICYASKVGTAVATGLLYAFPTSADWDFAAGSSAPYQNRLITPAITTTGCKKFYRVGVNCAQNLGTSSLGTPPEPWKLYYRTSGISDDSGSWIAAASAGDLTAVTAASSIQFMFTFRILGCVVIPARIYSLMCTYEDANTDSHYIPSVANSSLSGEIFAWKFAVGFGTTVPTLTVKLYDTSDPESESLLITDTTATHASGTFEKSTNGGTSWGAYDTTDKANDTTYIRYTPTSLTDNITVRALLTQ